VRARGRIGWQGEKLGAPIAWVALQFERTGFEVFRARAYRRRDARASPILGFALGENVPRARLKTGATRSARVQNDGRAEFFALPIVFLPNNSRFLSEHSAAISEREFVH